MFHENTSLLVEAVADLWQFPLGRAEFDTPKSVAWVQTYKIQGGDVLTVNERIQDDGISLMHITLHTHRLEKLQQIYIHDGVRISLAYCHLVFKPETQEWIVCYGLNRIVCDTLAGAYRIAEALEYA